MFYTVQELAATVKAWEYYVAILFLVVMIVFWQVLARESKARRKAQAAAHASQASGDYFVAGGDVAQSNVSVQPPASETKADCVSYTASGFPCWFARQMVSKRDRACAGCQVFVQSVERLTETAKQQRTANGTPKLSAPN